jgi:AraC-like DNA-binding protein
MTRLPAATRQPIWYGNGRTNSAVVTHVAYHKILHHGRIPLHTMKWNELGLLERGALHLSLNDRPVRLSAGHFVLLPRGMKVSSDESAGTVYWVGLQPASPQALAAYPALGAELLDVEHLIQANAGRPLPAPPALGRAIAQAFLRVHEGESDPFLLQPAMLDVIGHLRQALKRPLSDERTQEDWGLIRASLEFIAANPAAQPSLEELAAVCRVGRTTFAESFKRALGMPPHEYLSRGKMQRAEALLEAGQKPDAVAKTLGYSSTRYFVRVFRRVVGREP